MINFRQKRNRKYLNKPKVKLNLKLKMTMLIGLLLTGTLSIIGVFLHYFLSDSLEEYMGERALHVAENVARNPDLVRAFKEEDPSALIQPLVKPIQEATDAEFIVVGNKDEIRYAHPNRSLVGERMIGEDNEKALKLGESYVSKAVGSLGHSIRGKAPVIAEDGEIIGVVSVGFLVGDVQEVISHYSKELWSVLFIIGGLGIVGAGLIASYIKKVLFGLEPEEISHLYLQKEAILQSTHEGIIAVDQLGQITMMNTAAQHLAFEQKVKEDSYLGKPIREVLPASKLTDVLETSRSQYDREMLIGNHLVLVNRVPIYYRGTLIGAVSTFRNKTEIERLTKELTRIKQYAQALRAQTHEFSNKLYTILGLLQLDHREEAIEFIQKESDIQQEWIRLLIEKIPDPLMSAILLGKLNQANELGVKMSIHPDSQLTFPLSDKQGEALLTVVGNLIENAFDAVKKQPHNHREISIYFIDIGDEIVFEIEDSGSGIPIEHAPKIFQQGFSTKKGLHRGIGLALSKQLITDLDGMIFLEESELGGACVVVTIPKETKRSE